MSRPVVALVGARKTYGQGETDRARARRRRPRRRARRVRRDHGLVGLGQVDAAQPHRLPRRADGGPLPAGRRRHAAARRRAGRRCCATARSGLVFQSFNLIPRTSALANVELPLAYAGVRPAERRRRAVAALERVGLADRLDHEPNQLSGGQQQRVAVARALVTEPVLLLADEPTGALDSQSTADVLALFGELNADGRTVVVVTHEDEVARRARRVVRMRDGRIIADEPARSTAAGVPA